MKLLPFLSRLAVVASLTACLCAAASAQSRPKNLDLFTNSSYALHPDMDAVLELTPEQESRLAEAMEKRVNDPEVARTLEAFRASADDPEAKGAFYRAQNAAKAAYKDVVKDTLTEAQQSLILSINSLSKQLWDEHADITHWGERSRKMAEIGPEKLKEVLSPQQLARLGITDSPPPTAAPASADSATAAPASGESGD